MEIPLSREMPCPRCPPHASHVLTCDHGGCLCCDVPVPGVYPEE
jgi:hypothetical protein